MAKLYKIIIAIITGLITAIVAMAFVGPGTRAPGTGNPDFWIKNLNDIYYNPTVSGNVGVGTVGPMAKLHVVGYDALRLQGDANNAPFMSFYNQVGSRIGYIQNTNNSDMIINQEQTQALRFATTGTERMRIDSTGNVGIGTASLDANYKITTAGGGIKAVSNIAGQPAGYFDNPSGYALVTGSGNVGIGTATPGAKLHIRNNANGVGAMPAIMDNLLIEDTTDAGLVLSTSGINGTSRIVFADHAGSLNGMIFYENSSNAMMFNTSVLERMRITGAGNVGIGMATPGQKLSVAGTIESASGGFKFPDGTTQTTSASLKTYDSGWFAIADNTTYSRTHGLGTTKVIIQVLTSSSPDGSANTFGNFNATYDRGHTEYADYSGVNVSTLTTSLVKIRANNLGGYSPIKDENGTGIVVAYARIIMLALE